MKKFMCFIISALIIITMSACSKDIVVDYPDATSFETALNNGENLEGKIVTFVAGEIEPQSAFGYDIYAGEHLNFVSSRNPDVQIGDIVTVKVTEINSIAGSWIIKYEKLRVQKGTGTNNITEFVNNTAMESETTEGTKEIAVDYEDAESFERDLNAGKNLEGKTVKFIAEELHPDSAFGYNIWAGEHLNFISSRHPDINTGDIAIVKVTEIENVMGSWIISYEKISVQEGSSTDTVSTDPSNNFVSGVDNQRKQKNGFKNSGNSTYNIASYSVEIPDYWKPSQNEAGVQRLYAETGGRAAMILLNAEYESDNDYPVTFDGLYADNDNMIAVIETSMSCKVKDYEIINTENVKGILYKCYSDNTTEGVGAYFEWFEFASEQDRKWCSIILGQSDNTEFDYTDDFKKIIMSIKPTSVMSTPSSQLDTTIVFPDKNSKLGKDFDSKNSYTCYYINVDGEENIPTLKEWRNVTVTDGVAEYLDMLEKRGFEIKITSSDKKTPYSGYTLYETYFEVSNSSVSWTMFLYIQDEKYVEYELDIDL